MKHLNELASQVQDLFNEISAHFTKFQSGHNLPCPPECGKCCKYPDIQCSVLEMLPLAFQLTSSPQYFQIRESILNNKINQNKICYLFVSNQEDSNKGFCSIYKFRPSICRIFGVYGFKNKNNEIILSTCNTLKSNMDSSNPPSKNIPVTFQDTPMYWNQKLQDISPNYANDINHINESIRKALILVDNYFYYQQENQNVL